MPDSRPLSPCPLCRAARPVEVQRQILPLVGLGTVDIGFGYCEKCGHIYQVRSASDDLFGVHYEAFSNYTCFETQAARNAPARASTKRLVALAQAHSEARGLAYEVGCASAYHLAHFRQAGWRVGGCDLSPKACAQAKSIYGIAVDCGAEADILPTQKNLDLIYFSHVLEHLRDPMPALLRAHAALADDGMVLLEVPCAIAPQSLPPGWFTFEHLHYFSERTVLALLKHAGFRALEIRIALKGEIYPVIAAIAGKSRRRAAISIDPLAASGTRQFLAEFTARDDTLWRGVTQRLSDLSGGIFVWGAGVHTAQLLDRTPLRSQAEIVGIIDRDSQKWGRTQADCPIISPEDFLTRRGAEPVVISSYASEVEIARNLRQCGIAEDRIVRLYN